MVVTGVGMVTSLGHDVETIWRNIKAGKSGIKTITGFDASPYASQISGEVVDFDASPYMDKREARRTDPFIQFAMAACHQAVEQSELDLEAIDQTRAGIAIGSGIGGLKTIQSSQELLAEKGPKKVSPFFIPATIINMASGYASLKFGFKGPNFSTVTACSTGTHSIGQAAKMIAYDDADIMLAGGSEMATTDLGVCGFSAMRALSTRNDEPEKASRPWDKDHDGFVLGDGAGVMLLESLEHAQARGAHIIGEVAGFGMTADAYHITAPDADGGKRAMELALKDARLGIESVGYINAHATSTPTGDSSEIAAIRSLFGDTIKQLAISSTKSMTGHLLGAAGAIEAIFSVLALRDQIAPPTINLDDPVEDCQDINLVPNEVQSCSMSACLSNSFGFGGTNGSLLFKTVEDS